MMYVVEVYKSNSGKSPVSDFILSQEKAVITRIFHSIELLKLNGPKLTYPFSRRLQRNLFELRIHKQESIRIFYTYIGNTYYLLHVFKKQTNKTPIKELRLAIDRKGKLL